MPGRVYGAIVSVAMLAAVSSPLVLDPRRRTSDDFPLSTYPMFAWPRQTRVSLTYAVAITGRGERRFVAPALLGTHEVLQASAIVMHAVLAGEATARGLCQSIAARIAAAPSDPSDPAAVTEIAIVQGDHDAIDFLVRGVRGTETERMRCEVPRGRR